MIKTKVYEAELGQMHRCDNCKRFRFDHQMKKTTIIKKTICSECAMNATLKKYPNGDCVYIHEDDYCFIPSKNEIDNELLSNLFYLEDKNK
jgi:hypothetical protein